MPKYRMSDGVIVNTDNAKQSWQENTYWNGSNHISVATGSQWEHEQLYKSRKDRYYVVRTSQMQGSAAYAEWLIPEEAAKWLLMNEEELPTDLVALEDEVCE